MGLDLTIEREHYISYPIPNYPHFMRYDYSETLLEDCYSWELFHAIEQCTNKKIQNLIECEIPKNSIEGIIEYCKDKIKNYRDIEFPCWGCSKDKECSKITHLNELIKCEKYKYWYENKEDLDIESWKYYLEIFEKILKETNFEDNEKITVGAWW